MPSEVLMREEIRLSIKNIEWLQNNNLDLDRDFTHNARSFTKTLNRGLYARPTKCAIEGQTHKD